MKTMIAASAMAVVLGAVPASATFSDPPPLNPCPSLQSLLRAPQLGVLDVSGDGSFPACSNGVNAETAITCTSKEVAGAFVDFVIEYFDETGTVISPNVPVAACGVPPGGTVTFTTTPATLPRPWGTGAVIVVPVASASPGATIPCAPGTVGCFVHGSARVLATHKRVQCTATRIDLTAPCYGAAPSSLASKRLTIVNKGRQIGD